MLNDYLYMAGFLFGLLFILRTIYKNEQIGGKTKCFSCEHQDPISAYPSKCFSCEQQLLKTTDI
jgi:hypothetical protein